MAKTGGKRLSRRSNDNSDHPTPTPIELPPWQAADLVGRKIFSPFKRDVLIRRRYGDGLLPSEYQARIIEELHAAFPTIAPSEFRRMRAFDLVRYIERLPPAGEAPPQAPVPDQHSQDFRSITLGGNEYFFTLNQSRIVEQLWRAMESGAAEVSGETLLENAEIQSEMRHVFRDSPAWRTIIVPGSTKGTYRLDGVAVTKKHSKSAKLHA